MPLLVMGIDNGGGCTYGEAHENSVSTAQYSCKSKTAVKKQILFLKCQTNDSSPSSHASVQCDFAPPPIKR